MTVIAEPVALPVAMADARIAARANGDEMDAEIDFVVRSLTAQAEHYVQRAMIDRTHRLTLDEFPEEVIMPASPVSSVLSVSYYDLDGNVQVLNPDHYFVDKASEPGSIVPGVGRAWPETLGRINSVIIDVICGYGMDSTTVPSAFKGYILAKVREYFAPAGTPESPYIIRMLDSLRTYR